MSHAVSSPSAFGMNLRRSQKINLSTKIDERIFVRNTRQDNKKNQIIVRNTR
jgi:hypothetical protein